MLASEPGNERAWFLYAKVAENRQKAIQCLEKVLEINPFNSVANRDLEMLEQRQSASSVHASSRAEVSNLPKRQAASGGGIPRWVWYLAGGLTALFFLACSVFLAVPLLKPAESKGAAPIVAPPTVVPVPTNDCDCAQANAYLDATYARFDVISAQLKTIEEARDFSQIDFFTYSAEAKALYKEQLSESPPACEQAFHTKTISLLWNWQQSMQYAADEQYDAVRVFLQGFTDEFAALLSEGEKLGKELQLKGCIRDPDAKPNL